MPEDYSNQLAPQPQIIESASATTSPDNVNSGNAAYIIFGIGVAAMLLLAMGISSLLSLAAAAVSSSYTSYGYTYGYTDDEVEQYLEELLNDTDGMNDQGIDYDFNGLGGNGIGTLSHS